MTNHIYQPGRAPVNALYIWKLVDGFHQARSGIARAMSALASIGDSDSDPYKKLQAIQERMDAVEKSLDLSIFHINTFVEDFDGK